MQSTQPKVANCEKCNAVVFSCDVNGFKTLVDVVPIPQGLLIECLTMGRCLYEGQFTVQGQTLKRLRPSKALDGPRYAQHGCTVGGVVRATELEVVPVGPPSAPVTPGGLPGGFRPGRAPASGSQGHTAALGFQWTAASSVTYPPLALNATPRPSKPTRCRICNNLIKGDEQGIVAIQYGERMVWAEHVEH